MQKLTPSEQVKLYRSLFNGRQDVFAIRWEKEGKSGYMPAYHFDPYMFRSHKMAGGTFQNYKDKAYLPLTDEQVVKHLNGSQFIGIYPLLPDNTSWFLAVDFDKGNWLEESKAFVKACEAKGIPAYLERSRSGNGGHVWIFFDQPYPTIRSRKVFVSILESAGIFSLFDKASSFDRLFPNQDFLSGKGLGNLIALPLNSDFILKGNNCFLDIQTDEPYRDQWLFLKSIQRANVENLDILHQAITNNPEIYSAAIPVNGRLAITLNNKIHISRNGMPLSLISFLKEELNFPNSEAIIKKKAGRNTWGMERYYRFVEDRENEVLLPKGFVGKLIRFCKEQAIVHDFIDSRKRHKEILYPSTIQLRDYQQVALDAALKKDMGIIVAPPGTGKTVIGLKLIAEKRQPALIIVHRTQLAEQWAERVEAFLGIPKNKIGRIGGGKLKLGDWVTITTIQALAKVLDKPGATDLTDVFGITIIDECHHSPAETFRNTINRLNTYYQYGLTATPFRKYEGAKLITIHLGEVIAEIKAAETGIAEHADIIVRNTELDIPFNPKTDRFETLSKILVHDSARNKMILTDVLRALNKGRKVVIITERKEHIDTLHQYLKQSFEVVTLSGEDTESKRREKWNVLNAGQYQVLVTTGQFFGEGTDLQNAQCLFLVYPFAFEGKLVQYIGRVQRSGAVPTIYDYRDIKIDYLNKLFLKRNVYYRKIQRLRTLFDDPEEMTSNDKDVIHIEKKIKVSITNLDFRYGSVAFQYAIKEIDKTLEFDIEHGHMRPEFEVLKPYFVKMLKTEFVNVEIRAEVEDGQLVSQLALSGDLEKINQEVIESVKFRFVAKKYFGTKPPEQPKALLDVNQLQPGTDNQLFDTAAELLENILSHQDYRHKQHLHYLAQKHEHTILKLRFTLQPFSFLFLLAGERQYHLVLETLDTEEATYIWHLDKHIRSLPKHIQLIDQHLNIIRNSGRQVFLSTQPENFSRTLHDYTDERKGFTVWKDLLEERLW